MITLTDEQQEDIINRLAENCKLMNKYFRSKDFSELFKDIDVYQRNMSEMACTIGDIDGMWKVYDLIYDKRSKNEEEE